MYTQPVGVVGPAVDPAFASVMLHEPILFGPGKRKKRHSILMVKGALAMYIALVNDIDTAAKD